MSEASVANASAGSVSPAGKVELSPSEMKMQKLFMALPRGMFMNVILMSNSARTPVNLMLTSVGSSMLNWLITVGRKVPTEHPC